MSFLTVIIPGKVGKNNHSHNIRFCKMFKGRVKVGDNKTKQKLLSCKEFGTNRICVFSFGFTVCSSFIII